MAQIRDPNGHINFYSGVVRLPYYEGDLHQFMIYWYTGDGIIYQNLFFGVDDLKLKFAYYENDTLVYKLSNEGIKEKTFNDQDFTGFT